MNTDFTNQQLRELYESGRSLRDLQGLVGRSQAYVKRRLLEAGATIRHTGGGNERSARFQAGKRPPSKLLPNPGWDNEDPGAECNQELRRLYESGQSLADLMTLTNLSQRRVKRRLIGAGATIRKQGHIVGKAHSEELRLKVSKANKGQKKPPRTEEHTARMRVARQGRKPALGMRHSDEIRRQMSESRKGDGNGRWIDGRKRTPYPPEWTKPLRHEIRTSQDNRCAICEQRNRRDMHVHHIDWDKQNCNRSNLVGLCYICHGLVHRSATAEDYKEQLTQYVQRRDARI